MMMMIYIYRHRVTWWWTDDDEVRSALAEKQKAFKLYERTKDLMEVLQKKYQITKVNAKRIVAKVKDAERERIRKKLDEEYKKGTLFRVAKQMKRKNRDIVGGRLCKG